MYFRTSQFTETVSDASDCNESDCDESDSRENGEIYLFADDSAEEADTDDHYPTLLNNAAGFHDNASPILVISAALIMMVIQKNVSIAAFDSMIEVMLVSC